LNVPAYEVTHAEVADPTRFGSPTALAIRAGDFLYISGTMPWDPERRVVGVGDVKAQTRQVIRNMQALLQKEGGTLKNIVKITFFLMDIRDKAAVWEVRKEMFGDALADEVGGRLDARTFQIVNRVTVLGIDDCDHLGRQFLIGARQDKAAEISQHKIRLPGSEPLEAGHGTVAALDIDVDIVLLEEAFFQCSEVGRRAAVDDPIKHEFHLVGFGIGGLRDQH
jgi:enamine deaminase RidA (YjgF/YER057c/UK114 family)